MGRFIPGKGAKLNLPLIAAAVAPNGDPSVSATIDTWDCTLAGVPIGGDNPQAVIGLTNYGYVIQAPVQDIWDITIGGAYIPTDTVMMHIPGGVATPYSYVVLPGDDDTDVAAGLATAAIANGLYVATSSGPVVTLTQTIPGTGVAVTSGFTAGAGTAVAVNTQVGQAITPYATVATAIAAAITADTLNNGYTAVAVGPIVTITANVAGAPTKAVSSLFSPPSGGTGTFIAINTIPGTDAPVQSGSGLSLAGSIATSGTAVATLNAGTSYRLQVWYRDSANVWTQDAGIGNKLINATQNVAMTIPAGAMRAYAFVQTFIGGASATVSLTTTE